MKIFFSLTVKINFFVLTLFDIMRQAHVGISYFHFLDNIEIVAPLSMVNKGI